METPIPVSKIVVYTPSVPIVSAQKKPAMSIGMDRQMFQMKENMKEMQQQMK